MTMQTTGLTLGEIDYAFASKDVKECLEFQLAEAVQREDIIGDTVEPNVNFN